MIRRVALKIRQAVQAAIRRIGDFIVKVLNVFKSEDGTVSEKALYAATFAPGLIEKGNALILSQWDASEKNAGELVADKFKKTIEEYNLIYDVKSAEKQIPMKKAVWEKHVNNIKKVCSVWDANVDKMEKAMLKSPLFNKLDTDKEALKAKARVNDAFVAGFDRINTSDAAAAAARRRAESAAIHAALPNIMKMTTILQGVVGVVTTAFRPLKEASENK